MCRKTGIDVVAFGKSPKRIRREKIEKSLQELKDGKVMTGEAFKHFLK